MTNYFKTYLLALLETLFHHVIHPSPWPLDTFELANKMESGIKENKREQKKSKSVAECGRIMRTPNFDKEDYLCYTDVTLEHGKMYSHPSLQSNAEYIQV